MRTPQYLVTWHAPQYAEGQATHELLFFTSDNGFTAEDASAVADLAIGDECAFDNWCVIVCRLPDAAVVSRFTTQATAARV